MTKSIEFNDTNLMKGIAIIFIILHNLIHLLVPIKENEFRLVGKWIALVLKNKDNTKLHEEIKNDVIRLLEDFPVIS